MIRRPPRTTRTGTLLPLPTLCRSAAKSRCRYHEIAAACARKPRSTPRCVPSCGRFAFFFPPPNPPLVSTLPNLGKNGRKQRFDSGGKLVECRLFRVVVSHGKVGSDALCILLNFLRSEEHTSELQSLMRISYAVLCLKK